MSVRTYNPSVRVGNWNEDLCLEEGKGTSQDVDVENQDLLKDFLEKRENGELLIYKQHDLTSTLLKPVELSKHEHGKICFGDVICLYNPSRQENLSINVSESVLHESNIISSPCGVSASKILQPAFRNSFKITSCDGCEKDGDFLMYGQQFLLTTLSDIGEELKLTSDTATFMKNAKKSRLQEVSLTSNLSYLSHWQVLHFDPQQRMETEGTPVAEKSTTQDVDVKNQGNVRIMFNHCKTNQRLAVLPDYSFRTTFGREHEITAHTFLDSHKAEKPENHWILVTAQE